MMTEGHLKWKIGYVGFLGGGFVSLYGFAFFPKTASS